LNRNTLWKPEVSAAFLADLDVICPSADNPKLASSFLNDLETAYASATAAVSLKLAGISAVDLNFLEKQLNIWRTHHEELLEQYLRQLPSDDPLFNPVSLFGTIDYGRLEIAHTRALAWLLGDHEHGFGSKLIESLLLYLLPGRQISLTQTPRVEREYQVQFGRLSTDLGRIDILAEGCWEESGKEVSWRLALDAKIDAEEAEKQLSRYDEWLEQCAQPAEVIRVFLTANGREARTSSAQWQTLSFSELVSVFRRVPGLQEKPGYHFLRYYLTGVLRDVCGWPIPIGSDCQNPYAAVSYLESVLDVAQRVHRHG
jgi:hypothetical protein